jgi:predicted phosphodiesterase
VQVRSVNLEELADAGPTSDYAPEPAAKHPAGWEPGVAWDGYAGTLTTQPLASAPNDWSDLLAVWDLDPQEYEVVEPVQYRAWDAAMGEGNVQRMFYYRATIRRRRSASTAVEDALAALGKRKPKSPPPAPDEPIAYAVLAGDLQLGKPDGDGTAGTIERFQDRTDAAVARLKELRRLGRPIGSIYLPWLGDCVEGLVSQGGALAAAGRLDLTITEQVRVLRRLMLHQVQTFAPLAERIVVPVVPGNHDEAQRVGKVVRRYDDSWAVEGAAAVADALQLAPGYDHVSFVFPERDELTVTLDIAGTPVGMAHGHQFGRDPVKWWANQAHGMQPIGSATLLLAAHLHHLRVEQSGAKSFVQIPALDGGSTWWRHKTGQDAPAGMVSMTIGHGTWSDLAVL